MAGCCSSKTLRRKQLQQQSEKRSSIYFSLCVSKPYFSQRSFPLFRHHDLARCESRFDFGVRIVFQTKFDFALHLLSILNDRNNMPAATTLMECANRDKHCTFGFTSYHFHGDSRSRG